MTLIRIVGLLFSLLIFLPERAHAQAVDKGAVVVLKFTGPRADQVHKRVKQALRLSGRSLFDEKAAPRPDAPAAAFADFAERWEIGTFVSGEVRSFKNAWSLELTVRSGHNGEPVGKPALSAPWLPGLLKTIDSDFVPTVDSLLAQTSVAAGQVQELNLDEGATASPTPANDSTAEVQPSPRDEPAPPKLEGRSNKSKQSFLMLGAGVGAAFRDLSALSGQNPSNEFSGQDGGFAIVDLKGAFYPGALATGGFWGNVGVLADFENSVGGSSSFDSAIGPTVERVDVGTRLTSFSVGPRVRFPVLKDRGQFGVSARFGQQRMTLDFDPAEGAAGAGVPPPPPRSLNAAGVGGVPDVNYSFFRFGLDGSYRFSRLLAVNVEGAYRLVTDAGSEPGEIGGDVNLAGEPAFFPNNDVDGLDGGASLDINLIGQLDLRVGADVRYYAHDFNVVAADLVTPTGARRPNAGGATDLYVRGGVGVVWQPGRP